MTKLINEESLAETAKIIKQYIDENSGGDIDLSNYYTKTETDSTFLKQRIDDYTGVYEQDGIIMSAGTAPNGPYVQVLRNGDISIAVTNAARHLTLRGASNEVKLGDDTFTINGKQIATLADTLTAQGLQALVNNVLYPKPYTLKIYNSENVTTNYNSAWDGYGYIEIGEYPQSLASGVSGLTATGETYNYGDNTFAVYTDGTNKYATINSGTDYYKFEPLRWLVLATSSDLTDTTTYGLGANNHTDMTESGQKLLVLSEFALYRDYFDLDSPLTNKFSSDDCDLRVNMNGGFAEMAGLAQYFGEYIPITEYGTTWSDSNGEQFDNSSSNIFALGYTNGNDANVDTFHVFNYMTRGSEQAQAVPTEFAVETEVSLETTYGSSRWWLRSGHFFGISSACYVVSIGVGNGYADGSYGVRPSFILNLGGEND